MADTTQPVDLNEDFLRKAMERTSFNLDTKDFQSLEYKKEIVHLYCQDVFPNFECQKFTFKATNFESSDLTKFNTAIDQLKIANNSGFKKVFKDSIGGALQGFGPGEVISYIIVRNLHLAGSRESGDLRIGSKQFESKGAIYNMKNGGYQDFVLGGTLETTKIKKDIARLAKTLNFNVTERVVQPTVIQALKEKRLEKFEEILNEYRKIAIDGYFKEHPILLFNNKPTDNNYGRIAKKVSINNMIDAKKMLNIYRIKNDSIEPLITIPK